MLAQPSHCHPPHDMYLMCEPTVLQGVFPGFQRINVTATIPTDASAEQVGEVVLRALQG